MRVQGHTPRKRFGQNFLQDQVIIQKIIAAIAPRETDTLVEIGPGLGALTRPLLQQITELHAIEIDRDLIARLRDYVTRLDTGKIEIYEQDVLEFDFHTLLPGQALRLIGNLPYNISTPLLIKTIQYIDKIQDMHFMVQKELAQRCAAAPGDRIYGRLSVMLQLFFLVTPLFDIPATAFRPAPKVTSTLLRLRPHPTPIATVTDLKHLSHLVQAAFGQRRKKLHNALKNIAFEDDFAATQVDGQSRAEQISIEQFVALSNHIVSRSTP